MVEPRWQGARWWKFDFHTHTPASKDYGKGSDQARLQRRTPREWLLDFVRAESDCVAVTDHNAGEWIDRLRKALSELDSERPEGFGELVLFPAVDITANDGIHVLAFLPNLEEGSVRECIFHIMEGGREAFEQRYRRIALESRRV